MIERTGRMILKRGARLLRVHGAVLAAAVVLASCAGDAADQHPVADRADTPPAVDQRLFGLAQTAIDEERFADAERLVERVLLSAPDDREARLLLAEARAGRGAIEQAVADFERLTEADDTRARALQGKGLTLLRSGRRQDGCAALADAVAQDPALWRAWNGLGYCHDLKREWAKANDAYDRALSGAARPALVYNNRGYSLLLQNRPEAAIGSLTKAVALDPSLDIAKRNLRLALAWAGEYRHALVGARGAEMTRTLNNVGFIAVLRGDYAAAESYLLQALEHDSGFGEPARRNLAFLKSLQGSAPTAAEGDKKTARQPPAQKE